jgi:hypothetical protein
MKNEIPLQSFHSAGVMNRHQVWKVAGLTVLVCGLQLSGAQGATYITPIDPSGIDPSGNPFTSVGTVPTAINQAGVITGNYNDSFFNTVHGFVRAPNGTITTFDAPGAGTQPPNQGTYPTAINVEGVITGYFIDANNITHAFLRAPKGTLTAFDAPGAGTQFPPQGTQPFGIKPAGQSRVSTLTLSTVITAFCGPPAGASPPSIRPQSPIPILPPCFLHRNLLPVHQPGGSNHGSLRYSRPGDAGKRVCLLPAGP